MCCGLALLSTPDLLSSDANRSSVPTASRFGDHHHQGLPPESNPLSITLDCTIAITLFLNLPSNYCVCINLILSCAYSDLSEVSLSSFLFWCSHLRAIPADSTFSNVQDLLWSPTTPTSLQLLLRWKSLLKIHQQSISCDLSQDVG